MTPAPEAERPLPCPFCGAEMEKTPADWMWQHPQADCIIPVIAIADDRSAIASWNRRAPDAQVRPVGSEALDALERLARAATRGPWYQSGSPWFATGALVLAGSPDRHAGEIIVDTDPMDCREDVADGVLSDPDDDAAYIAAANPSAVLALVAQVRTLTEERERLRAALEKAQAETARMRARWHAAVEMGAESDARAALGAP